MVKLKKFRSGLVLFYTTDHLNRVTIQTWTGEWKREGPCMEEEKIEDHGGDHSSAVSPSFTK